MESRVLGATGLLRSRRLDLVATTSGGTGAAASPAETLRTIAAALNHGVTLFDTANSYVSGRQRADAGRRVGRTSADIVLCSKAGHGFWASLAVQRLVGPFNRQSSRNFRPSALETAVAGSLRRLRTDRLDVLYLHNPPPRVVQDDDVLACVERMKSKGYIRFWGISCARHATADDAHQAVGRKGVAVVQIPASCVPHAPHGRARSRRGGTWRRSGRAQPFGHGDLLTPQVQPGSAASPGRSPARTALTYALQARGAGQRAGGHAPLRTSARKRRHRGVPCHDPPVVTSFHSGDATVALAPSRRVLSELGDSSADCPAHRRTRGERLAILCANAARSTTDRIERARQRTRADA